MLQFHLQIAKDEIVMIKDALDFIKLYIDLLDESLKGLRSTQDQSAEDIIEQFRIEENCGRRYYPLLPAVFAKTVQKNKKDYDSEAIVPGKRRETLSSFFERNSEEVSFLYTTSVGHPPCVVQVENTSKVCTYLLHKGTQHKKSIARLFETATVLSSDTPPCIIIGRYTGNGKLELRGEGQGLRQDSGLPVSVDHKGRFSLIGLNSGTKYKLYECTGESVHAEEDEHRVAEGERFRFIEPIFVKE